jgi:DNA polymerase-1
MTEKRLVILDGYSLLYRAFFATRYLSTSDGKPTNALFGFTSMLFQLLERNKPDAVVIAFDAPGKTFRHAEFAEYKGTRKETAPELIAQFPVVRELMTALGVPNIEVTGYEADDVVGTISRMGEENGYKTMIVTGDLDSLQLVDEWVSVMTTRQGVTDVFVYGPEQVRERFGFGPEHVTDYKAIAGDSSDNIPGVPGIGEKGATAIIQKFGTVENVLERFDELEPKYQKKIEPAKALMIQSKWLATIDRHVPLEYDFKPFHLTEDQIETAERMLESLEFRSLVRRVHTVLGRYVEGGTRSEEPAVVEVQQLEVSSTDARTYEELRAWVGDKPFAMLQEPTAVQPGMFDEPEMAGVVAVGLQVRRCKGEWAMQLLKEAPTQAILHDSKPLYRKLCGLLPAPRFDSMLAGYVLQSGRSSYALRDLVQGYLEVGVPSTTAEMAAALGLLEGAMRDRLGKESQTSVLDDVELPLVPILAEMENYGIEVSSDFLGEFSKSLEIEIQKLTQSIHEQAGVEFNIGSPKQLGEVLFEKLEIPGPKKTKTGYATGAEVLQLIAPTHQIATDVLSWRELSKLKSTYSDSLPRMIGPDGRIHTTFNQTVAATGRLSSNEPNLQNIPIRTELGRQIRKAFVAAKGYELASFDYSQIELRLLAHLCRDDALVEAFQTRVDVHTVTASLTFGIPVESVSKEQRRLAKMLNYAVLYGVTDFGLANQLGGGFSVSEAKALITQYFERFPKIKNFTEGVVAEARTKGFTVTLCGRRRYFPDIHSQNRNERMGVERQAVNAPIQGAAADMIKLAMIRVRKAVGSAATRMLLQVHDELVFELAPPDKGLIEPIRKQMEDALPLSVPVEVDAKIGENWNEMSAITGP